MVCVVEVGILVVYVSLLGDSLVFDIWGCWLVWCLVEFNGVIVVNVLLVLNVMFYFWLGDWVLVMVFVVMGVGFVVFLCCSLV